MTREQTITERACALVSAVCDLHAWQVAGRNCKVIWGDFCEEVCPVSLWADRKEIIDAAEAMYDEPWVQRRLYPYGKPRNAHEMELLQAYLVARHDG
jgi:hypothetical protein